MCNEYFRDDFLAFFDPTPKSRTKTTKGGAKPKPAWVTVIHFFME